MPERPIYWHQGLFLQPQHLQLSDPGIRPEAQPVRGLVQPHLWGVSRLEFDQGALEAGKLALIRGEFLFKDGTYAAYPDNAVLFPRSLEEVTVSGDAPVMVYVAVKGWDPQGGNATEVEDEEAASAVKTRFSVLSSAEETPDLLADGPSAEVKFMRYTLALCFEHELEGLESYQRIPVARLVNRGEKVQLDPDYVPPCLQMNASEALQRILNNVTDLLASRCRQLEGYKSPEGVDARGPDMSYMVLLLALRTLSRYASYCLHLGETGSIHPWQVYGTLRQLVGELSTFSLDVDVLGSDPQGNQLLPAYDHEDISSCFSAANQLVVRILDSIEVGPELLLTMSHEPPFYRLELPDRVLKGGHSFWLVLSTESDPDWVFASVDKLLKLSPSSGMTTILTKAVSGIPIKGQSSPPPGLPRRPNSLYFHIDTDSPLWEEVRKSGDLTLFWDEAPEDLTAQIAVLGKGR